jgi:hypothetical protein
LYTRTDWHLEEGAVVAVGGETQKTSRAMRRTVRPNIDVESAALVKR